MNQKINRDSIIKTCVEKQLKKIKHRLLFAKVVSVNFNDKNQVSKPKTIWIILKIFLIRT